MATVTSFEIDAHLAPAGAIAGMFRDLCVRFWDQPHLPTALVELIRLDLAVMHRADAEQSVRHPVAEGIDPAKIDAVLSESWRNSPEFSAAEKSVLDFTEYYVIDPQSIPDEIAAKVVGHFGENGLVCLVEALGFIDSRIRLSLVYSTLTA